MGKSAGSGGGGGDQRNKDIEGRSSRPSGGGGNVFGVNGVSKTGSTARDAAIGFTSGEGTGRAGANFDALQGATRETRDRAVAAAQQAQRQGASLAAQQRAAGSALGVSTPGSRISQAVDAMRAQQVAASRADEGAGIGRQPPIGQGIAGITGTGSFLAGNQARPPIDLSMRDLTNTQLVRQFDESPEAVFELQRRAEAGDQQAARDLARRDPAQMFINNMQQGIDDIAAIKAIGADLFDDPSVPLPPTRPSFEPQRISADEILGFPGEESRLSPPVSGGVPLPPTRPEGISSLAPAQDFVPGTGTSSFYSNLTDLGVTPVESISDSGRPTATSATPQGGFYGEDTLQADVFGMPGGVQGELYGFPDAAALGEFQSNAMRGPNAISQLMDFSLLNRGVEALTGTSPSESNMEAGRQNMRNLFDLGGAFNPETGRVEAALPSGQLQMNQFGNVTYSGMPDPNYTGAFSNLVNPPEREGGQQIPQVMDMVEEAPADPCPAGYAMVNGSCQPTDQMTGGVQAPEPVAPPVFQPTYQPFQPQPLNPFVLSPQSGISGISPTGAALGRSV
jgi:hypothetical protein